MAGASDTDRVVGWLDDPTDRRGIRFRLDDGCWQRLSYPELAERSLRAGAALADAGVQADQLVPLMLPNGLDLFTHFFGLLAIGATPSVLPLPWAMRAGDGYLSHLNAIIARIGPSHAVVAPEFRELFDESAAGLGTQIAVMQPRYADHAADAPRRNGQLALVQFTSGSQGRPRGIRITMANLAANLRMMQRWMHLGEYGAVSWLPTYHDLGLVGSMLAHSTLQLEHAMMRPQQFLRDPSGWLTEYGRTPYAAMIMPNFGFDFVCARVRPHELDGLDFSHLRHVVTGAERVDPAVLSQFYRLLAPHGLRANALMPAYGLAECTLAVSGRTEGNSPRLVRARGLTRCLGEKIDLRGHAELSTEPVAEPWLWQVSCGQPLEGIEIDILDESGLVQPEGVMGEILVRGASVSDGYLNPVPDDAAKFEDGGFRTGDVGFLLDGELYVIGRLGDSMKVNGQSVFMEDIELELTAREMVLRQRTVVVAGITQSTPTVLVVTENSLGDQLPKVVATVRSLTGDGVAIHTLQVRTGSILRTSSGKPRRGAMWLAYLRGMLPQVTEPVSVSSDRS